MRNTCRSIACCLLGLALVATAACGEKDPTLRWAEDVTLPDGRIVTVKREQRFDRGYAEDRTKLVGSHSFELTHPDTGEIVRWSSQWGLETEVLFIHNKTVFLIVNPGLGMDHQAAGCPNPFHLLFRYDAQSWKQISILDSPTKKLVGNMIRDPKDERKRIEWEGLKLNVEQTKHGAKNWRHEEHIVDLTQVTKQDFQCPHHQQPLVN